MSSNCYLVVDEDIKHCLCIDPASEKSYRKIEYIKNAGLILDYIILTHEHTDHTWGVNSLVETFPEANVICSDVCQQNLSKEFQSYFLLYYDDPNYQYKVCHIDLTAELLDFKLDWYNYIIEFISTPGHSLGSICILIDGLLFTGDTILLTRPYVNRRNGSKVIYRDSVQLLMNRFAKSQLVYPGHGLAFHLGDAEPFFLEYFKQ